MVVATMFSKGKAWLYVLCITCCLLYIWGCSSDNEQPARESPGSAALRRGRKTSLKFTEEQFMEQRMNMVEHQIRARGVKNEKVLEAMREVPRHKFVPEDYRGFSYHDSPQPIGEGQTISQPYIVALMTELMEPEEGDVILEVGTGSGYQAAVLAEIVKEVYTIEIIESLAKQAEKTLDSLEYDNVHVRCGDGFKGLPEHAPFDGIIVTCAPSEIPPPLIEQLEVGGTLVIPVGEFYQELKAVTKTEKGVEKKTVIPVRFVPMTGEAMEE